MEEILTNWLKEYGYIILFFWSILEGELGLIMGGVLSHTGDMNYGWSVFVAGLGGFAGDQFYFYLGRWNKGFIQRKFRKQRRKFAIAHILLKKYGWTIIFFQRYMYGLRMIIPMSIGITKYSSRQYAIVNLLSAWIWAAVTITPAYIYGAEILDFLLQIKQYWYLAIPVCILFVYLVHLYIQILERQLLRRRKQRR